MSTSTSSSSLFTGSSRFSSDLAQVISRSVAIASLPVTQLNNSLASFQNQSSALSSLDSKVTSLQSAATAIQTSLSSGLLSASASTSGILNPTIQSNATAGTYTVEVASTGSYASALSQPAATAITDPTQQGLSTSTSFTLSVGGVTSTIQSSGTSLNNLVDAINSQSNGAVQATVVNVGGSGSPDYRLSFQSTKLGDVAIGLTDGSNDLIASHTSGSLASYKIDGIDIAVTSDSRTISIAPGLQVSLLAASTPGSATTITVAPDATSLQSSLNTFARAYNAVVDELATHHGTNAGALQGNSILNSVSNTLQTLGTYSNGNADSSLAAYGISLDTNGHLAVDPSAFSTASASNFKGLVSLIGSSTGGGFLGAAHTALTGLEDPTNGILKLQETQVNTQASDTQNKITEKQNQVNRLQSSLQAQMAHADAAIAALEQQVSYFTNLFTSERSYNLQGY